MKKTSLPSLRLELIISLLGLLGFALFFLLYDQAFPSAAIRLDRSRAEVRQIAEQALRAQGFDPAGYHFGLTFSGDGWASIFLQQTLGIPKTNQLVTSEGLPLYFWRARWFRPLEKEEFLVWVAPDGRVVALEHRIAETEGDVDLPEPEALAIAQTYLTGVQGWDLEQWELVESSSVVQPGGRRDYVFEWRRPSFQENFQAAASDRQGELRLTAAVYGAGIGRYDYWVRVPEAFNRHFSTQSNRAYFITDFSYTVAIQGFVLVGVIAFALLALRGLRVQRQALVAGAVAGGVSLLSDLNQLPLYVSGYGTTQDYSLYWVQVVFNMVFMAALTGGTIAIIWIGARAWNKLVWPTEDKILPRSANRWQVFQRSMWRGLMFGGVWCGYAILFYLVATRLLGGWAPMGSPYTNLYATPFPFLAALESGLIPALQEELLDRLIGIALLLWLFRKRWLALLVPGLLWGFAHLSYIRDPFYMRGIELTLLALLAGYVFLKFDLTTTIVAHFTYNALLTALPLLRADQAYFIFSGGLVVAIILSPLALAAWKSRQGRQAGVDQDGLQVIPAAPADLPALQALGAVFGENTPDWTSLLQDPQAVTLLLRDPAQPSRALSGVASGRRNAQDAGEVLGVWVVPELRRQYWGTTLAEALERALREQGWQPVVVDAEIHDPLASSFWASQGWQPVRQTYAAGNLPQSADLWQALRKGLRRKEPQQKAARAPETL